VRAWQISSFGIDSLEFVERPTPSAGPRRSAGQNCARFVQLSRSDDGEGLYNPKMKLPRIPCSDGAGEVVAVGEGVTQWKPGDRVAGIFMQNWLDGPLTQPRPKALWAATSTACWPSMWCSRKPGLVAARPPELSGGRHAALRRRDGLERAGRGQPQAGIDGADPGNRRRLHLCAAVCAAEGRARAGHQLELREAGAGQRWAWTRDSTTATIPTGTAGRTTRPAARAWIWWWKWAAWARWPRSLKAIRMAERCRRWACWLRELRPFPIPPHSAQMVADSRHLRGLATGLCGDEPSHFSCRAAPVGEEFDWTQAREVFERMEEGSHFGKMVLTPAAIKWFIAG
jgi:hypothetical protein